jgi:hypothetical protein
MASMIVVLWSSRLPIGQIDDASRHFFWMLLVRQSAPASPTCSISFFLRP